MSCTAPSLRWLRPISLGLLSFSLITSFAPAAAAKKKQKSHSSSASESAEPAGIMVRPFSGPKAKTIEEAVVKALEGSGLMLIPSGFEGNVELGKAPGPYVEVAKINNIRAYVTGKVKSAGAGWSLELSVRNGKDGRDLGTEVLVASSANELVSAIKSDLLDTLSSKLDATRAPGPNDRVPSAKDSEDDGDADLDDEGPRKKKKKKKKKSHNDEPAPAANESAETPESQPEHAEEEKDDGPEDTGGLPAFSPLELTLGAIGGKRSWSYNQPVADVLEYKLQEHGVPFFGINVKGEWYPALHFTKGLLSHFGIAARYYQSIGASTKAPAPISKTLSTSVAELDLGLRARAQLGPARVGLGVAWGMLQTVLADTKKGSTDPGVVPDAAYSYWRVGPDVELALLGIYWKLGAGVRLYTVGKQPGQIANDAWFPRATAKGFDANLDVAIPLSESFAVAVGAEFHQIGLAMNSKPADNVNGNLSHAVAGGAIDRYLLGTLGIRWSL
jgi:hypothetical protein